MWPSPPSLTQDAGVHSTPGPRANGAPSAPAQSEIHGASPPLGQGVSLLNGFLQRRLGPHSPWVPVTPFLVPAGSGGPGLLVCERSTALWAPHPHPHPHLCVKLFPSWGPGVSFCHPAQHSAPRSAPTRPATSRPVAARAPAVVPPHHPAELPLAVGAVVRLRVPETPLLLTELLLELQGI